MKKIIFLIIVLSYIIPSACKLALFLREERDMYWLALPVASSTFLALISFLTFKGSLISKYAMCIFFLLGGLCMIPYYFAPAIETLSARIFLGSYGVMWVAFSVWIFRAYPEKERATSY